MKRLIFILALLLFNAEMSNAQASDSLINGIRFKYQVIRNSLEDYNTITTEIWNQSAEGGQGTAYYAGDDLKLIEVIWLGETGKRIVEYYFDNGELIFAFNQEFRYNRPIYWDEQKAKEFGDNEFFDPKKTTIKEDRYYFEREKLIHWLDNKRNEVDLTSGTNLIVGQEVISHALKMKSELKK